MEKFKDLVHFSENIEGIVKIIQENISFQICSGCSGVDNPYSKKLQSEIGMGCDECYGSGVVLLDYRAFPEFIENEELKARIDKLEQEKKELVQALELALKPITFLKGRLKPELVKEPDRSVFWKTVKVRGKIKEVLAKIKSEVRDE